MELKASFLFDTSLKGSNKEHEKNISKAIAGFMNSHEGGTLFIGVDKDSNIVGLDNDYSIVKNYNSDRFELQLRNSLEKYLKRKIIHELIKVNFHHIKRKKICEIIISPSSKPIILYDNGKQEFYVRIGNSTRPYNIEEFFEYSKTRFKNEY